MPLFLPFFCLLNWLNDTILRGNAMSLTSTLILKRPNLFKVYILHHSFHYTAPMQAILRSIYFVCTHGAFHIVLFDCQDQIIF